MILLPNRLRARFHIVYVASCPWIVGIHYKRDKCGGRHKRFVTSTEVNRVTPVILPFGPLRLATRPERTGSGPLTNTIGIVDVASLIASAAGRPGASSTVGRS